MMRLNGRFGIASCIAALYMLPKRGIAASAIAAPAQVCFVPHSSSSRPVQRRSAIAKSYLNPCDRFGLGAVVIRRRHRSDRSSNLHEDMQCGRKLTCADASNSTPKSRFPSIAYPKACGITRHMPQVAAGRSQGRNPNQGRLLTLRAYIRRDPPDTRWAPPQAGLGGSPDLLRPRRPLRAP